MRFVPTSVQRNLTISKGDWVCAADKSWVSIYQYSLFYPLDKHRGKNEFMEKFPQDICIAETKTKGNPNILNEPMFRPIQKTNYSGLFGSPAVKKLPKALGRPSRGRLSRSKYYQHLLLYKIKFTCVKLSPFTIRFV